jgi:hypothetical protein
MHFNAYSVPIDDTDDADTVDRVFESELIERLQAGTFPTTELSATFPGDCPIFSLDFVQAAVLYFRDDLDPGIVSHLVSGPEENSARLVYCGLLPLMLPTLPDSFEALRDLLAKGGPAAQTEFIELGGLYLLTLFAPSPDFSIFVAEIFSNISKVSNPYWDADFTPPIGFSTDFDRFRLKDLIIPLFESDDDQIQQYTLKSLIHIFKASTQTRSSLSPFVFSTILHSLLDDSSLDVKSLVLELLSHSDFSSFPSEEWRDTLEPIISEALMADDRCLIQYCLKIIAKLASVDEFWLQSPVFDRVCEAAVCADFKTVESAVGAIVDLEKQYGTQLFERILECHPVELVESFVEISSGVLRMECRDFVCDFLVFVSGLEDAAELVAAIQESLWRMGECGDAELREKIQNCLDVIEMMAD